MILELEYKGETEGKVCPIYKLYFSDNQKILYCPNCESLFHEEHLLEWLSKNNDCPVCERDFTNEIEKYNIRKKIAPIKERDTARIKLSRKKIILYNPDTKESYIVVKGVTIFFGLIFALAPTVAIALLVPFPIVLAAMIFSYIFYFGGMAILNHARTQYRFYWNNISFSKKEIIIGTFGKPSKEVKPKEIKDI